jgi:hypothetical protein
MLASRKQIKSPIKKEFQNEGNLLLIFKKLK